MKKCHWALLEEGEEWEKRLQPARIDSGSSNPVFTRSPSFPTRYQRLNHTLVIAFYNHSCTRTVVVTSDKGKNQRTKSLERGDTLFCAGKRNVRWLSLCACFFCPFLPSRALKTLFSRRPERLGSRDPQNRSFDRTISLRQCSLELVEYLGLFRLVSGKSSHAFRYRLRRDIVLCETADPLFSLNWQCAWNRVHLTNKHRDIRFIDIACKVIVLIVILFVAPSLSKHFIESIIFLRVERRDMRNWSSNFFFISHSSGYKILWPRAFALFFFWLIFTSAENCNLFKNLVSH